MRLFVCEVHYKTHTLWTVAVYLISVPDACTMSTNGHGIGVQLERKDVVLLELLHSLCGAELLLVSLAPAATCRGFVLPAYH